MDGERKRWYSLAMPLVMGGFVAWRLSKNPTVDDVVVLAFTGIILGLIGCALGFRRT